MDFMLEKNPSSISTTFLPLQKDIVGLGIVRVIVNGRIRSNKIVQQVERKKKNKKCKYFIVYIVLEYTGKKLWVNYLQIVHNYDTFLKMMLRKGWLRQLET